MLIIEFLIYFSLIRWLQGMREVRRVVPHIPRTVIIILLPQIEAFEQLTVTFLPIFGSDPIHRLRSHLPARLIRRRDLRMHPSPRLTDIKPMPIILNRDARRRRSGRLFGRSRNRLRRPTASQQTHRSDHSDKTTDKTTHTIFHTHYSHSFQKNKHRNRSHCAYANHP